MAFLDLAGQKIGRLTPVAFTHVHLSSGRKMPAWECVCECGVRAVIQGHHLRGGKTQSCGCLSAELSAARERIHGESRKTKEYGIWATMINRCHLPTAHNYRYYGARGISVCARWRFGEDNVSGYECFLADMGRKPDGKSIDRINNDGNYEPGNCRWATQKEQVANQRRSRAGGV